ncbi:hypothetical protein SPSIL_015570 [Sporomusa silvacetica DSM 10669]|uniref:Uncharacterized protein n=1 Tax=Sporomusa silvacetica DSM 10669 TaxID=1123289 RepID=A0ABZ3IIE5_9FIRM|nr:hypothetical protein SPSIL_04580 [Sporomusa silvacetica DSM 10669]
MTKTLVDILAVNGNKFICMFYVDIVKQACYHL